jgi:ribosome-binding factor A
LKEIGNGQEAIDNNGFFPNTSSFGPLPLIEYRASTMEFKRADRVADLLQREIAEVLYRSVKDPRLAGITISGVEVSSDLRHARVFYYARGGEADKKKVAEALAKAKSFIRRELGKRLHLRYLPDLHFFYDSSFDYSDKIDELLKKIAKDE